MAYFFRIVMIENDSQTVGGYKTVTELDDTVYDIADLDMDDTEIVLGMRDSILIENGDLAPDATIYRRLIDGHEDYFALVPAHDIV